MELTLHPLAKVCRASGRAFVENDRVLSYLVREANGEVSRHDLLASEDANYVKPGFVFCSWTVPFKAKRSEENPERAMKLTAENIFVTLADPAAEPNEANVPMIQFLALLLERKKILRPRGKTANGERQIYEHAKTHLMYEVPVGTLDAAFFVNIQSQLDLLVGGPKKKSEPPAAGVAAAPAAEAISPATDGSTPLGSSAQTGPSDPPAANAPTT